MLIVEDDPALRDVMAEVLADADYPVVTAPHRAAGLVWLQQTWPCLILVDLMKPILDGFGVRAIQRTMPQFASTLVIVLSAFAITVETAATLDAAYLSKPMRFDRLVEVVERYCQRRTEAAPVGLGAGTTGVGGVGWTCLTSDTRSCWGARSRVYARSKAARVSHACPAYAAHPGPASG